MKPQESVAPSTFFTMQKVLSRKKNPGLKEKLRRAERWNRIKAFLLVVPLLVFVGISFIGPITEMLHRSVYDPLVADNLPKTITALQNWDRQALPEEAAYRALVTELLSLQKQRILPKVAGRLNTEQSGMRSLMTKSARKLSRLSVIDNAKESLIAIDQRWQQIGYWSAIANLDSRYTLSHYLAAVDMRYDEQGDITAQPEQRQIYKSLFIKTLGISLAITLLCLLLGYPLAYMLATLPDKQSNLLMIMVLLPFWTSLLVRTTSWIVLLQTEGVINDVLMALGVIDERIQMIHNLFGTLIAMTHILLPFMILPLYSVMKGISPTYMRAARSLGANPVYAFIKIYMPQTLPGVGAGAILTFILSIGFYITPALVGGRSGQMVSNFIAYHMQTSLNWGLAAAIGGILLAAVLLLYYVYNRLVGINSLKMG
ncbi:ABC transporter permease [Aestuariirhabdus sp. Z084]|uniref:ABC transporter permease n=1 Tax=Aestuariirhabdus haliotis TaxID=2918751 RepID=UPI00201B4651|nr:ABC transporter permease [Aestuariirhabdus haliotis]MCL6416828.1 ABC transporter permease [Aestuariirhabdus haliotis]MCL6420828.1 ABC transporter permease [Aestuariirhabdus haliotis]